jgi:probable O-glycosylation ligase (exosortase A-associated)
MGNWFTNPIAITLLLLQVPVFVSVATAVNPELCLQDLRLYESVVLMALLIPLLIHTEAQFRWMMMLVAGSMGLLGAKFGYWGILHGGVRFPEGHGGFIDDNNGLALAMTMTIPLCWYCAYFVQPLWQKAVFWFMALGSMATVIQTYSRGNSLALAAVCFLMAMRSKRKITVLVVMGILLIPIVLIVGDSYLNRMATLKAPTTESSAASRLVQARVALQVARDYPLFGVGFGGENYIRVAADYLGGSNQIVVHNTYLQMMTDSGIFAFLCYLALLWGTIVWLGFSARRMKKMYPGKEFYPRALQLALIGFAIGSTFYSRIKFEPLYTVLMCSATWYAIEKELRKSSESSQSLQQPVIPSPPRVKQRPVVTAARRNA